MPYRFYTRRFLNKRGHHAGGYVFAYVEDTSRRKDDCDWTDTEFTVADCGRQICLSFDVEPGELANSLHKVDVLINTLTSFRQALVEEGQIAAERARQKKTTQLAASKAAAS